MQRILNQMRLQASLAMGERATVRVGIVSSYHPESYSCKVMVQPENEESGWLPVLSPWVGNGWGLFAPPSIGDMVDVHFQEGSFDAGFISQGFFNNDDRPLPVPSGEFWLVHQSGSSLKFHNDGTVELHAAGTLTSTAPQWNHTGPVDITGNVAVTGNITATGNVADAAGTKTMAGMRTTYDGHHHGAGPAPTEQM